MSDREQHAANPQDWTPEEYAWSCAEDMRGWALRAEETTRQLRAALYFIVKQPNGCGDHHPAAVAAAALEGRPIPNV